mgnify:CR=1 FL=1
MPTLEGLQEYCFGGREIFVHEILRNNEHTISKCLFYLLNEYLSVVNYKYAF